VSVGFIKKKYVVFISVAEDRCLWMRRVGVVTISVRNDQI
jgi:hypothetical protein